MPNADELQRRYLRSEAERIRLKHLNAVLRGQLEKSVRPRAIELSPLPRGFLPSDDSSPHNRPDSESLWKKYAASNAGLNKRFKIYFCYSMSE